MTRIHILTALVAFAGLSACGTSTTDRAVTGGAIGAATGAAAAAATGGTLATGAVLGGAAGAAVGAITDPEDIDLGTPVYR